MGAILLYVIKSIAEGELFGSALKCFFVLGPPVSWGDICHPVSLITTGKTFYFQNLEKVFESHCINVTILYGVLSRFIFFCSSKWQGYTIYCTYISTEHEVHTMCISSVCYILASCVIGARMDETRQDLLFFRLMQWIIQSIVTTIS